MTQKEINYCELIELDRSKSWKKFYMSRKDNMVKRI